MGFCFNMYMFFCAGSRSGVWVSSKESLQRIQGYFAIYPLVVINGRLAELSMSLDEGRFFRPSNQETLCLVSPRRGWTRWRLGKSEDFFSPLTDGCVLE